MPVLESSHIPDDFSGETSQNSSDYASTEHSSSYSFAGRSEADTYYTQAEPTSAPQDVNSIQITIADKQTPLVLLVGPPACGKTMTLIRLARFLKEMGYQLEPVRTLRPSTDKAYLDLCNNFNSACS